MSTSARVSVFLLAAGLAGACAKGADGDAPDPLGASGSSSSGGTGPREASVEDDASEPGDASAPDAPSGACAAALAALTYDFESGAQGWTHGISDNLVSPPAWPYDPWATGTATNGTPCKSGKCFAVELTQNYAQCQRGYLLSPPLDLSACSGKDVSLVFHHAFAFWTGSYNATTWFDGGVVEVSSDGSTWQVPQATYPGIVKINPNRTASYQCTSPNGFGVHNKNGYVGVQLTTTKAELPIPASAISATTRVRFSFASGVSSQTTNADTSRTMTAFGWRIDDVTFVEN